MHAKSANIILVSQDKKAQAIEYSKYPGLPWITPPLINIQNFKGKAKEYQVRQVLGAIEVLEEEK